MFNFSYIHIFYLYTQLATFEKLSLNLKTKWRQTIYIYVCAFRSCVYIQIYMYVYKNANLKFHMKCLRFIVRLTSIFIVVWENTIIVDFILLICFLFCYCLQEVLLVLYHYYCILYCMCFYYFFYRLLNF